MGGQIGLLSAVLDGEEDTPPDVTQRGPYPSSEDFCAIDGYEAPKREY